MNDQQIASKANELLESNYYTRTSLAKAIGVSRVKLERIAKEQHIPNYPRLLNQSQAASHGVKTGRIKWGSKFYLKGSPNAR